MAALFRYGGIPTVGIFYLLELSSIETMNGVIPVKFVDKNCRSMTFIYFDELRYYRKDFCLFIA